METPATPILWRINDFRKAHGISRATTYNLIRDGKLKALKQGTVTLIPETEAEKWRQSLPAIEPRATSGEGA